MFSGSGKAPLRPNLAVFVVTGSAVSNGYVFREKEKKKRKEVTGLKRKLAAAVALLLFLCSGCGLVGFNTQDLMRPPKPTGEKSEIQRVFEEQAGDQITLKYPQKGDYRSAIIMHDLNRDGSEEAILFYRPDGENMGTHLMVIAKVDGSWTALRDFTDQDAEVDRVFFEDLNGDGIKEIIVGWSVYTGASNRLAVYAYDGRSGVAQIPCEDSYSEIFVHDFNGDGIKEILIAAVSGANSIGNNAEAVSAAQAKLISFNQAATALVLMGSASLDPTVTRYGSSAVGTISPGQTGVVLDGVRPGSAYISELVYWDNAQNKLVAPLSSEEMSSLNATLRSTAVVSNDINGDGVIDLPVMSRLPGYADAAADTANYLTSWNNYDPQGKTLVYQFSMVANYTDGYYFILPDDWRRVVTDKSDAKVKTLTFHEWVTNDQGVGVMGAALLRFEVFTRSEWQSGGHTDPFFLVGEQGDKVFAAFLPQPDHSLSLSEAEVRERFQLTTTG